MKKYGVVISWVVVTLFLCLGTVSAAPANKQQMDRLRATRPSPALQTTIRGVPGLKIETVVPDPGLSVFTTIQTTDKDADTIADSIDQCADTPFVYVRLAESEWMGPQAGGWVTTKKGSYSSDIVVDGTLIRFTGQPSPITYITFPEGSGDAMPAGGGMYAPQWGGTVSIIPGTNYTIAWIERSDGAASFVFSHLVMLPEAWVVSNLARTQEEATMFLRYRYVRRFSVELYKRADFLSVPPINIGCTIMATTPIVK